jgi:superfamily II DNA helicase RecQ
MKFKVFAIKAYGDEASEWELNEFLARHKIIQVEKQFIAQGATSFWSLCVCYQSYTTAQNEPQNKRPRVDYKEVLSEDEFTCFAQLREIRKQQADRDGVPVFAVFTNEQLAALVQKKVISASQMKAVEGVGDSKVARYGEVFLSALRQHWERENA